MIGVDQSRPLRRPLDLRALVEAVASAQPQDEGNWVEWKSDLDLRAAEGVFKAAKAILSFANRMPDVAERTCGGLAYLVVGAEPGSVSGTTAVDAADLEQALARYLGADGPEWSPHFVQHRGANVLVIIVEAPRWGDPIHTLRRAYDRFDDGTVFVRSQSRSRPANSVDLRQLQDRLVRGRGRRQELFGLEVTVTVTEPGAVVALAPPEEAVEDWIGARRNAITQWQARQVHAATQGKGSLFRPSVDEGAIEEHLDACRAVLFDAQRRRVFASGWSVVTVTVANSTPNVLEDVELTLHMDGLADVGWSAWDVSSTHDLELPDLPRVPRMRNPMGGLIGLDRLDPFYAEALKLPRVSYESPDLEVGDNSITLALGQLRPERPRPGPRFSLVLHADPKAETIALPWSATSASTSGILRGTVQVPLTIAEWLVLEPAHGIPDDD